MEENKKYYKWLINVGGDKPYTYRGYKISSENGILIIQDQRCGRVRLNQSNIIVEEQIAGDF